MDDDNDHLIGRLLRIKKKRYSRKYTRHTTAAEPETHTRRYSKRRHHLNSSVDSEVSLSEKTELGNKSSSDDSSSVAETKKEENADVSNEESGASSVKE